MRKPKTKIDLHHHAFGVVLVTSAGRTDAGHYLICACNDGHERRLLTDPKYWLDEPQKVQATFDATFAPVWARGLKEIRRGERYDTAWRARRGGKMPLSGNADEPQELSSESLQRQDNEILERVKSENAAVVASVERLAEIKEIATLEETTDLAALVLGRRGPIRLPQRARVVA